MAGRPCRGLAFQFGRVGWIQGPLASRTGAKLRRRSNGREESRRESSLLVQPRRSACMLRWSSFVTCWMSRIGALKRPCLAIRVIGIWFPNWRSVKLNSIFYARWPGSWPPAWKPMMVALRQQLYAPWLQGGCLQKWFPPFEWVEGVRRPWIGLSACLWPWARSA